MGARLSFIVISLCFLNITQAQIKIGDNPATINASSILEIESTSNGLLLPRVALSSTSSFAPLVAHVVGMVVYNTATAGDVTPGYYYNDGFQWVRISDASKEPWFGSDDNGPATLNTEDIYAMGKVGIGATAPSSKLDVHQTNATGSIINVSAGFAANNLEIIGVDASTMPSSLNGLATVSSNLMIRTPRDRNLIMQLQGNDNTDGFHIVKSNGGHVFTANYQGRVGIGNTMPSNKLEITSLTSNTSGLRFSNLNAASTTSTGVKALGVDNLGDVVAVQSDETVFVGKIKEGGSVPTGYQFVPLEPIYDPDNRYNPTSKQWVFPSDTAVYEVNISLHRIDGTMPFSYIRPNSANVIPLPSTTGQNFYYNYQGIYKRNELLGTSGGIRLYNSSGSTYVFDSSLLYVNRGYWTITIKRLVR